MADVAKADAVEVECPFCLRPIFAVEEHQLLIHARPACAEFEGRTTAEILQVLSVRSDN